MPKKSKIYLLKVADPFKVAQPQKIRPQGKIHNFSFKNSNIVIEGIIQKTKVIIYKKNLEHRKIM